MQQILPLIPLISLVVVIIFAFILIPMIFRVVVETNKVHIVQSRKKTTSYGTGQAAGNVYYKWPSWFPVIGITRIILPVNNFNLSLHSYKAYDKERVPFELDLTAFFRIANTNKAAERIASIEELNKQLEFIVQGAARKIMASHDINQIMTDRATFGQQFTDEVKVELSSWGVEPVKNMELMDIRDSDNSKVITNIMAKKSSLIEMESRIEVAKNNQAAETAEIEAQRTVDISRQEAEQQVGQRTAEKEKMVGVAKQKAQQDIKIEEATTTQKQMDVVRVGQIQQAEINKAAAIITSEQQKEVTIINTEAQLEATKLQKDMAILDADAKLEATKRNAQGIQTEGEAKADAEKAMQLAPVEAQITLAKEIGNNTGYQNYLISLETVKGYISVGQAQAKALEAAEVKIIANTGNPTEGVKTAMELFTSKGGLSIGSMLEALNNTPQGAQILENFNKIATKAESEGKTKT